MTKPLPGTPFLRISGEVLTLTSDSFAGANGPITGRITDAAMGGDPMPWIETNPGSVALSGGKAVALENHPGAFLVAVDYPGPVHREIEMGLTVVSRPKTGTVYLDMFRDLESSTASSKIRVSFSPNGGGGFQISRAGVSTQVPGTGFALPNGANVRIRINSKTRRARIYVDGAQVADTTLPADAPLTGSLFGFAGGGESGVVLDDFTLTETVL